MKNARESSLPFDRLGDYEVLAPISEGGMASVWLGRQPNAPDQLVALKVIRAEHGNSSDFVAMFQDEARIAARLSHPNIIAVVGFGHDGRRHFIAMEPLRGRTLLEVWEAARLRGRRLPYAAVAWIGARVADALHHAHELCDEKGVLLQVVHRDVNPSNIFLTLEGVPKLIDFGLARALDRISSTATGIIKGKLAYLAPEQAHQHPFDRRADVFALGITLWEVSLDRRLFKEDADVDTVRRVREAQVPNPAALDATYPPALANVITRALARDPRDRFATAGELRDELDAFACSRAGPADKSTVAKILRELFGEAPPALWEKLVANAATARGGRIERIQAWDDERQKLTWMQASVQTLIPQESLNESPDDAGARLPWRERLDAALVERLASLERSGDRVARSRAHLERAIVDEALGEAAQTASHACASLNEWGTSVAHGALRRQLQGAQISPSLLEHLDFEIASCGSDSARADLLAERARLLHTIGESPASVRAAWVRALQAGPSLPAALGGLEQALWRDLEQSCDKATRAAAAEALATHLGRTASIYEDDPRLCAWLHVERAHLLEQLAEPSAAKVALARALELDSRIGPVRSACVAHAVEHRDAAWLVTLLAEQADLEEDPSRAARLELDAACIARLRLGAVDRAVALLERAAARAPGVSSLVRRRTLDELVSEYEAAGRASQALDVRRSRLAYFEEPRGRAHELRAIAYLEESLGDREAAIASFESALKDSPSDTTLVEALDRLLERASLTDQRIELWARHSASAEPGPDRARRLVRAAQLAEASGDGSRSAEYLRAALVACPTDASVAEQLLRLLASQPSEP
ncbi:MAG TPA: serine/threonine-protein kinase, partial [Polyangiaceae bacterium]|nr:serine/threonine-protein kinase [Polyangiaceae bacterium]